MIQILSYSICVVYIFFIVLFIVGWRRSKKFEKKNSTNDIVVSIVIAIRNESDNILRLLQSLANQTYQNIEIILVNDHSIDNSLEIMTNYANGKPQVHILNSIGEGKKKALREGISSSKGDLIVSTDADCVANPYWIETLASFHSETQADMIIAPVMITSNKSSFQDLQALEFLSLQATSAGAAGAGFPIMCNGANLAFTRTSWQKNESNIRDEKLSGDDMFLMMSIKKQGGKIEFVKSVKAAVYTFPCNSLKEFINQRKRWASKSSSYKDWQVILVALSVLGISSILMLDLFLAIFFNPSFLMTFCFIFISKLLFDRILLSSYSSFCGENRLLKWAFPLSIIYPFYITHIVFWGFVSKFSWKGRTE
jgi:cellulose synthase/poly-beta-1,6-N-acetylglucosamine synthase-like glycosyltransferase